MFRFLLLHLLVAAVIMVPCLAEDYEEDDSESSGTITYLFNRCPNEECAGDPSESEFHLATPSHRYGYYSLHLTPKTTRLRCCKLKGLRKGDRIWHSSYEEDRPNLRQLVIEDSKMESIPSGMFTDFEPSTVNIINGGLTTLKIADFTGAKRLTEFNATRNKIDRLEPHTFIYASDIESIDLSDNRITEVSEYSFENLPQLRVLILSNNLIKKLDFKSNLVSLSVFMISNNSLTYLHENLLAQSTGLTQLSIDHNELNITKLNITSSLDFFDMSNNLMIIQLRARKLRIRSSYVKSLIIDITASTIDASNNQIDSIEIDPNNRLTELNLSRNKFTKIQNFTVLKSIEKLDLSFNKIQDFSLTSFYDMSKLTELNLENSGLKIIDFGLFSQQKSLTWLDISYNNLGDVNFNMLTPSIDHLFIEGNGLTNLDLSDIGITLPHLAVLGLSNNKFSCEKLIQIRKTLTAENVLMHVDELFMVKFSRNINGIGCVNENSSESMELSSGKLLPLHANKSDEFIETIHSKIREIETNIRQHSESLNENSINSKDDILSVKQELMSMRSEGDLKIMEAKADILLSVSRLFNVSTNGTDVSVDLKSAVEEINMVNLERYQSLSLELKVVRDKLQDLVQSVANLKLNGEIYDNKNVLNLRQKVSQTSLTTDGASRDLMPLKNMMTFIIVTIVSLILGFSLIVFYKRFYKTKRRYMSTNTISTNVEQSLV